jgi:putative DNA primase/helicase
MNDVVIEFIEAMRNADVGPKNTSDIVASDTPTYYDIDGDKKKGRGSYCLADDGDGFGYGWIYSHKTGECVNWHTKAKRGLSDEDKAAHRARVAAAKIARDASRDAAYAAACDRAAGIWASADRDGVTGYLTSKGVGLNGARVHNGMVCVPMYRDANLVGLQFINDDGGKVFLKDTEKKGAYHSMRGPDMSVIRVCEGFATGAAIRECWPDNPVIVAFDAGNLKPVCVAMAKRYPDAKIVVCGDNDQWRTKPDGTPENIGQIKAQQAAVSIGGAAVMLPPFPPDDPEQRTDWHDYLREYGVDATRDAMTVPLVMDVAPMDTPFDGDDVLVSDTRQHLDRIRPLGFDEEGRYVFFPVESGRLVTISGTGLGSINNLLTLVSDINFWELNYGDLDGKPSWPKIATYASAELINVCHEKGVFRSDDRRGVGAWRDDCGFIVNTGKRIYGDGIDIETSAFEGDKVYESGVGVIDMRAKGLSDGEAQGLYDLCHKLTWKRPEYAKLLAGWLVVSGVGGALTWRPHIWLTGPSGSGKSTIMDKIIKASVARVAVIFDGGTTEAAVRKYLGSSSRPFIMDEAESESIKDRANMDAIISLFRKASSGGVTANANGTFNAMSCACFAAINPNVKEVADQARITLLELDKDRSADREARYRDILVDIAKLIDGDFDKRLFKFAFENIDTLTKNIATFNAAATSVFGNPRTSDQLAPMLAGAYMLTTRDVVTFDKAVDWINADDWEWFASVADENDSEKLVAHIMTSRVSYDTNGVTRTGTIGDLVELVKSGADGGHDAHKGLKATGVKVDGDYILIANTSPNMTRILRDTPWVPWARTLGDFKGSHNADNKAVYFMTKYISKAVAIPIGDARDVVVGDVGDVELDF